jgi:hypothetical protein
MLHVIWVTLNLLLRAAEPSGLPKFRREGGEDDEAIRLTHYQPLLSPLVDVCPKPLISKPGNTTTTALSSEITTRPPLGGR